LQDSGENFLEGVGGVLILSVSWSEMEFEIRSIVFEEVVVRKFIGDGRVQENRGFVSPASAKDKS
jgi:hypothetical protein